jgi:hypothetical protein
MGWLHNAILQSNKPKLSVVAVLRAHLGGNQLNRPRTVVHASDITQPDFCPRRWALMDHLEVPTGSTHVSTALDVTFRIGKETERLLVEEWCGENVVGNWRCDLCNDQRTMVPHPGGFCKDGRRHVWRYRQIVIDAPKYGVTGSLDAVFNVGSPRLMLVEVKILNTDDFDKIQVPKPEHRYRTNLYLKLLAESGHPYADRFNLHEARVLYVSRGYGRMNPQWNEILPFKEFEVQRDDASLTPLLQRAKALQVHRDVKQGMPSGICDTATDKIAQKCSVCKECFSGDYPATILISQMSV